MRRATSILVLALPAAAVALVALVNGPGPEQSSSTIEAGPVGPARGETESDAEQAQGNSSRETDPDESTLTVPPRSTGTGETWASPEALVDPNLADEETVRKRVRERATWAIRRVYSLLVAELGLTPQETEALYSQLIEDRIAGTWTAYKRGKTIDEQEQAKRIAAIIGDAKLREFLALEQNLYAYGQVRNIEDLLRHYDVPLADSQRDELLTILTRVREQYEMPAPSRIEQDPLERLDQTLARIDERQRHVLELAPSVLSPEQVRYLFEQYQHMSYERAASLEEQRRAVAAGEDVPIPGAYPGWHPMWQRHN